MFSQLLKEESNKIGMVFLPIAPLNSFHAVSRNQTGIGRIGLFTRMNYGYLLVRA